MQRPDGRDGGPVRFTAGGRVRPAVAGRSLPFEALLIPRILPEALKLTDPRDLSPQDEKRWREVFLGFLAGVRCGAEDVP